MNRKIKTILTVAIVFFSTLLLAVPQLAMAKGGRGGGGRGGGGRGSGRGGGGGRSVSRGGPRSHGGSGRRHSGGRRHGGGFRRGHRGRRGYGYGRSSFGLSFGFSDNYYSTSSQQWIRGYFQTHTLQILVEPAHYELQTQQVQVEPERYEIRQIPAVEETRHDEKGNAYKVVVSPARTETIRIPAKYQEVQVKVWIPDRYETRQTQVWIPGRWVYSSGYAPGRSSSLRIGGRIRF